MTIQLIIPGRDEPLEHYRWQLRGAAEAAPATDLLNNIEVVYAFDLSQPARSAAQAAPPRVVSVEDDDILEIEVEGGLTLWTSARRYQERVALWRPEAISDRGMEFTGLPGPSVAERGIKEWFTGAMRVLRLKADDLAEQLKDPKQWENCIKDLALEQVEKAGAWATAKLLMYLIEKRLTPGPGLYRWAAADADAPLDLDHASALGASDLPTDKPILVFIHGTASRTLGSFGAFCESEASQDWRNLRATFGEHIYVFEHRTMSESPIDNAVALAACLPDGAQISLVTHSRGGQVGDLLCLGVPDLGDDRIERFQRAGADFDEANRHDRRQLQRLRDLLQQKRLRIMRVARVACPARGTLLASDNIDEFLSLLTNLIGFIPGVGQSPIYEVIKRVTLQVVQDRTDPGLIPGIEAMMPTSPLVALLNNAGAAGGEMGVIAGDIEGGNWLKRIAVFVTDRFIYEQRDNDLVVNTDSMFYGARRVAPEFYVFDQGSDVSHFNYFKNERTRSKLTQWLKAPPGQTPQGFTAFERGDVEPAPMPRSLQTRAGTPQPVVFVLPGIMGSNLDRKTARIWMDYAELVVGGLGRIKDIHDDTVTVASLVGEYYDALCKHLADSHEVLPFAYDWRRSIRAAAAILGIEVDKVLKRTDQPVRFVAHSMGGLVVRRFIADHADLWEQVCARPGSRFMMLGTPNRGSHSMVETLIGAATTVRQLALVDVAHDLQRVVDIVGGFQGALELLPQQAEASGLDWYTEQAWQTVKQANKGCGAVPAAQLLADARSAVTTLPEDIPHADCVVYVAGSAPITPCAAHIDGHGRIMLTSTDAGDGRVTHAAGKLPGVATWYMAAEHGELADYKPAFPALVELLEQGRTSAMPTTPPALARGETMALPYLPQPVLYPTRGDLVAGIMGKPVRNYRRREPVGLHVSVVHGDLRYATHPVMVGHYLGDTIVAAEEHLDRQLRRALSQRYQLGIYPGAAGTTAVIRRPLSELEARLGIPRGAIVIGLGRMGDLGTGTLANAVREGALQYALQTYHSTPRAADAATAQEIGLSALLIGANSAATVTVEDSVAALMRAVAQANVELERARIPMRINHLEIIELFSDAATQAAHAASRLAPAIAQSLDVRIDAQPELGIGRNGRLRRSQLPAAGQWRRWAVTAVPSTHAATPLPLLPKAVAAHLKASLADASQVDPATWRAVLDCAFDEAPREADRPYALRYVAIADRARTEVRVQQLQPELIEKYVELSRRDSQFRAAIARTLWELLLPNELKDGIGQISRLVLEVDAETASYPWELMVNDVEPLCVQLGFVRQLETANFRTQIRATTSNTAYVVGDPITSDTIPSLPGARAEAKLVASLLAHKGFAVEHNPERPGGLDVFNRLYAQPYRILHLAGHGYYESATADKPAVRSGMVLEGGLYLTAVEIAKMRHVPDLVFINCCHLGQVGPEAKATPSVAYNKLAASLSRELIEMGVRAVVAAGWAVRDDAANCFAKAFYTAMLDGATFGDALLQARSEAWTQFRDCNTWGAYQAYGDPGFRLNPHNEPDASGNNRRYASADEVLYELGSIRIEIEDLANDTVFTPQEIEASKTDLKARLTTLQKNCPAAWQAQGSLLYRFARAYSELGEFQTAIDYYQRALAADEDDGRVDITAAEQLANLEARLGQKTNDPALIQRAIDRLGHLIALGTTRERLALLGSAYKRLAQVSTEREPLLAALNQSAAYYKQAAETGNQRSQLDPYHALNWLTLEALQGHQLPDAEAWLARCEAAAIERHATSHKLWDAVALPDADIARRLLHGALTAEAVDTLVARYREVFTAAQATPREQDSVVGQLRFIKDMLERLGGDGVSVETVSAILAGLAGEAVSKSGGATQAPVAKPRGGGGRKKSRKTSADH